MLLNYKYSIISSAIVFCMILMAGCSVKSYGFVSIDNNFDPDVIVSYRQEGEEILENVIYKLVKHEQGLAMMEYNEKKGTGSLSTNHWVDDKGDHFSIIIDYKHMSTAWEYIVPQDRSKNAFKYRYQVGTYDIKIVNGVEIPVPVIDVKPRTILVPIVE